MLSCRRLCVALALLSATVLAQDTTTTTTTTDGVTRTIVKDSTGKVISETTSTAGPTANGGSSWSTSWSTAPSPAGGPATASGSTPAPSTAPVPATSTPAPPATQTPSTTPTSRPPSSSGSVDTTKDAGPMTIGTNAPQDGGPMTISTQAPQSPQPQTPQATPAPQRPQPHTPQATPAPQTPATTKPASSSSPAPSTTTAAPKPTLAPSEPTQTPAETTATPASSSEAPGDKKTSSPTTPATPGTTPAPGTTPTPNTPSTPAAPGATPATPAAGAGSVATPPAADGKPTTVGPSPAGSTSLSDKASEDPETPASSTVNPLSDGGAAISNSTGRSNGGGSSWGVVIVVAGVICALVGISGFALVNRRRKMEEQDAKTDRNANNSSLDFESVGVTPADGRDPHNMNRPAPGAPPAALSPQRVSYEFRRASNSQGAMPTPVNASAVARPTPFAPGNIVVPAVVRMGPSILDSGHGSGSSKASFSRQSSASYSRPSQADSDSSFMSSASVAPPPYQQQAAPYNSVSVSSEDTIDEDVASFVPTDSFVQAMTVKDPMNDSIVSSNMEYEFGEDSSFRAVGAIRGTDVNRQTRGSSGANQHQPAPRGSRTSSASVPQQHVESRGSRTSSASIPKQQPVVQAPVEASSYGVDILDDETDVVKGSYDFDADEMSDDDLNQDEEVEFDTDSTNGSFAHTFYEPRDDSYSDDYRGSDAGSAIRGSTDSLFSRSSSEFGGRATDDSLA